jgi:hypothetical protein
MSDKEFVTYEQSLALKELGFNEECFGYYVITTLLITTDNVYDSKEIPVIKAPLKQQVFRWFREKYELYYDIFPLKITASNKIGYRYSWEIYNHIPEWIAEDNSLLGSLNYEEAENACIDKLIEITKQEDNEQ